MSELKVIKDSLKLLGATPNSIKFFLTSYKQGKSSIGKIALICKMDRSSAYLAHSQLRSLGLMEEDFHASRKTVWTKPPKSIIARLRSSSRKIKQCAENIETALPSLMAAYNLRESKPVIQFFSGPDGLRQISADVLEHAKSEILLFSNQKEEKKVFNENDHKEFIQARIKKGIRIKVLAPESTEARLLIKKSSEQLREIRLIPGEAPFKNEIYIYGDKVAMLSFNQEVLGFIILSKEYADAQKWMFNQIWNIHG